MRSSRLNGGTWGVENLRGDCILNGLSFEVSLVVFGHSHRDTGSEELSSLPLQVMLYFNNLMFPVVLFAGGWSVRTKMTDWEELELNFFFVLITTIMFVVWALLEAIRLFAGWPGNLKEKVPQLTGFVMLTGFQVPISCYHLFLQAGVTAFDRGLWTAVLLFTVPEMVFGFRTVKRLIRSQAEGFYLAHVDDADGGFGAGAGESSPTGEHPSLLQGGRRRM